MNVMRISRGVLGRSAAALGAVMLLAPAANAGLKYQSNVVQSGPGSASFILLKAGKLAFKASSAPGKGGVEVQLSLSKIDCPPDNDNGVTGKCGPSASPVTGHVLELGISFAGLDLDGVAGIEYDITKGKTAFQFNGKNKIPGTALGALVSLVFDQPLGIGIVKLREPGSNPTDCNTTPLAPGNGCTDGDAYAIAGIVVGNDPSVDCAGDDTQCSTTAVCSGNPGICVPEQCTVDADCDEGGGTGTGECGGDGECCDPDLDPGCAAEV